MAKAKRKVLVVDRVFMSGEDGEFPANCGILVLASFSDRGYQRPKATVNEHFRYLAYTSGAFQEEGGSSYGIVAFSSADYQVHDAFSPLSLCKFLRAQGERVTATAAVKNPQSSSKIVGYYWVPSAKFRNKIKRWQSTHEEEQEQDGGYDSW